MDPAAGHPRQPGLSSIEAQLERVVSSAPVILWSLDRDGVIRFVRGLGLAGLNVTSEQLIGRSAYEVFADFEEGLRGFERALRGEEVSHVISGRGRVLENQYFPVRDESGAVIGVNGLAIDITERAQAQERLWSLTNALERSAQRWRATFDAVPSPILIAHRDGRVRRLNRAARDLAARPYSEVKGALLHDVGAAPIWRALAELAARVVRDGRPHSFALRDEAAGRAWDIIGSPLPPGDPDDGDAILLASDVSRTAELQESLRRSETMSAIGRLVVGVAHEVRNPLFAILATLEAFEVKLADRPGFSEYGRRLRGEVGRLSRLMQDLLDYGRPSPPGLAAGSLRATVEEASAACEAAARAAGVSIDVEPLELPDVVMDAKRLVQVFQNLIENAVQHAPAGTRVRVSGRRDAGGFVEVCVSDSGPGFDKADLPRLFEPFFTRRNGGTGLGLSIVERIVAEHGGRVRAENGPGGGAVVHVELPADQSAARRT